MTSSVSKKKNRRSRWRSVENFLFNADEARRGTWRRKDATDFSHRHPLVGAVGMLPWLALALVDGFAAPAGSGFWLPKATGLWSIGVMPAPLHAMLVVLCAMIVIVATPLVTIQAKGFQIATWIWLASIVAATVFCLMTDVRWSVESDQLFIGLALAFISLQILSKRRVSAVRKTSTEAFEAGYRQGRLDAHQEAGD